MLPPGSARALLQEQGGCRRPLGAWVGAGQVAGHLRCPLPLRRSPPCAGLGGATCVPPRCLPLLPPHPHPLALTAPCPHAVVAPGSVFEGAGGGAPAANPEAAVGWNATRSFGPSGATIGIVVAIVACVLVLATIAHWLYRSGRLPCCSRLLEGAPEGEPCRVEPACCWASRHGSDACG